MDTGDDGTATAAGLTTDQRGLERFIDGDDNGTPTVDVGAFEGGPLVVSTLVDENDGDYSPGDLSLREALAVAAATVGDDVITFDGALTGGTIALEVTLGHLVVDSNVDVQGLGSTDLAVDGDDSSRGF